MNRSFTIVSTRIDATGYYVTYKSNLPTRSVIDLFYTILTAYDTYGISISVHISILPSDLHLKIYLLIVPNFCNIRSSHTIQSNKSISKPGFD